MSVIPPARDALSHQSFPPTVVFGATGRLGRVVRRHWPAAWPVKWVSRSGAEQSEALDLTTVSAARLGDLLDGAEAVISLAGDVGSKRRSSDAPFEDHVVIAERLATAAKGVPLFLPSSAAVYGPELAAGGLLSETLPLSARTSAYGAKKRDMESTAIDRAVPGSICCLRIGNVAGCDAALGGWRPGFTLDVFADGRSPLRSYIGPMLFAEVLAALVLQSASSSGAGALPPVLNIAQPGAVEMAGLLKAAKRPFSTRPAPPDAIARVELDVRILTGLVQVPRADTRMIVDDLSRSESLIPN